MRSMVRKENLMEDEIGLSPTRLSSGVAVVAALVTVAITGLSGTALLPSTVGIVLLFVGILRSSHRTVTFGSAGLLIGVLVAGIIGMGPAPLLIATGGVILAWDVGGNAITMGEQMGRTANTKRAEGVHILASLLVAVVAAGGGYLVFRVSRAERVVPSITVVSLLVAVVLIVVALKR